MNYTENYNLLLPEQSDRVDVRDLNTNSNTIDGLIKDLSDAIVAIDTFIEAISDPSSTEERKTLIARLFLLGGSLANATFTIGGGGEIDISQTGAIKDAREPAQFVGNIMAQHFETNDIKPHNITTTNIQKVIDGDFKTKTIETTALKVLSAATPTDGKVIVRTSENLLQESEITLDELDKTVNNACSSFITNKVISSTIKKGRPCFYYPNQLGYTSNSNLSSAFVGIALADPVNNITRIATNGHCKVLVYKDPSLSYNPTFGLTGKAYASSTETGGFQAATSISDLGGFTVNTRKPRILLEKTDDYNNMPNDTWALLDAVICMV